MPQEDLCMRIFKWLKKFSYLVVLLLTNVVLSFLIEPEGGASGRTWAGYYQEENLDTIFVGSSVSQQTFIPEIFNDNMGVQAYNLGTPSQAIPQTLRAIEVVMEEHELQMVVFGMGFSSLKYGPIPEAELTFENARTSKKGGLEGVLDTLAYIYSEDVRGTENSINFLFPWLYNYENYAKETLLKNAMTKIENIKEYWENGSRDETDGLRKGYRNDDVSVLNYDDKCVTNTHCIYGKDFVPEMLEEFERMLKFCNENNLDLIIVNTPHPAFDVVSCYEYYEDNQNQLKAYCEKYDVDYYDFSLAKAEIFENRAEYFGDFEHLNKQGSEAFCQQLSEFLNRRKAGEDMDKYFYPVEEFLEIHSEEVNDWKEWNK